jgi:hypothetical protein
MATRAIHLRLDCVHLRGISSIFFAYLFPSLTLDLIVTFSSVLYSGFVLPRLFYSVTDGVPSPEWVKPTAEGG